MSKISQITTIRTEDFPSEERKWMPRLLTPLNLFITNTTQLLNNGLNFVTNVQAQDQNFQFAYAGEPQKFRWTLAMPPRVLWLGQCTENAVPVRLIDLWTFDASTQNITVSLTKANGDALTLGYSYRVFLRIVP